jgi:hypothetical protein
MGEGPLLVVWAAGTAVLAALALVRAERSALDDPVQKVARGEVTGLSGLSFLREERLDLALGEIAERSPAGEVTGLRIEPGRVDAQVREPSFRVRTLRVDAALEVEELGAGEGVQEGLAIDRIPPGGPERLVRTAARRAGTSTANTAYVTLVRPEGPDAGWSMKLGAGPRPDRRDYVSNLEGRRVRGTWQPAPAAAP